MFAIHQRVRRRICQAAFCLLCLMPTTGLLAWTMTLTTAGHAARCQQELGQWLGMETRFERVRYPQPGLSLYEGFELLDAETGQQVLRCRTLGITHAGRKLLLEPSEVELSAEQGEKLLRLVVRRLSRELPGENAVWVVPTSVTLRSASGDQTYDDLEAQIESQPEQSAATVRFRLPDAQAGEPPVLSVVRQRSGGEVATVVKLDTMSALLPVSIFAPWLDLGSLLGDEAAFRGSLALTGSGEGWSGELAGVLTEVDLERLVTRRFPHALNGRATVVIKQSKIENGRLAEASGQLLSESGMIGGSLLVSAVELLGCVPRQTWAPGAASPGKLPFASGKNYGYRSLSVEFTVDEQGLLLEASPDAEPAGAILLDEDLRPRLSVAPSSPLPLIQLVKALVPNSLVQVPATKETALLVPWLPLPAIVLPDNGDRAMPAPPLRVK
jgi:hypothetical protein